MDVTAVTLNKVSASLYPGESLKLSVAVSPANAKDKSVTWSSSDESVVTVDNTGKVTAVAAGTDYTVAYKNNTKVGNTGTNSKGQITGSQIIIKMKGEYSGNKTIGFNIVPMPLDNIIIRRLRETLLTAVQAEYIHYPLTLRIISIHTPMRQ